jgi:hypothetical protein
MPLSITYNHPSLSLGNVVDIRLLNFMTKINRCQVDIDTARDKLNSLIQMKRSITMTINELQDIIMNMDNTKEKQTEIDKKIDQAATDYLSVRMAKEEEIQKFIEQINQLEIPNDLDSIIDFSKKELTILPLSSESLNMDSQYFSFGSSLQDDTLANVEKFIRSSAGGSQSLSDKTAKEVTSHITNQIQNHNISGTLIIVANCTHQKVRMFEPVVIDPDKAVAVWNTVFKEDKIVISKSRMEIPDLKEKGEDKTTSLSLITGASYGSSFIGMVHILKSDSNQSDDFENIKKNIEKKMKIGGWLANVSGGFGINEVVMNEVKAILSSQSITSHISIITLGAIPSFKSKESSTNAQNFALIEENTMKKIRGLSPGEKHTTTSDSSEAQQKALLLNIQDARISMLMKNMQMIDQSNNKMLDINSLMTAFDNYIESITKENNTAGVPNNFYIKKITKADICDMWMKKYFPENNENNKHENNTQEDKKK